jgi:hypothetical protein
MTALQQANEWMREMRRGDWEAAWRISDQIAEERRGLQPRDPLTGQWLPRHLQWVWNRAPLSGQRVLVRCYHGLGDTIQFARFIPALKRCATHVTVLGQPQLLPLLETMEGIDTLQSLDESSCEAEQDLAIEIMELPYALRTTLLTLPRAIPYIHVDPNQFRHVSHPRVGLVWQSGSWDESRSVAPQLMRELLRVPGIEFSILQRGPALASWQGGGRIPALRDIREEAAELQALDLLVSVDTLSAHLAGALGVPTWTLLPALADWRWMEDREDTPWYPTMRLFRQTRPTDWESVIARVRRELQQRFGS